MSFAQHILIHVDSLEKHRVYVKKVLQAIKEGELFLGWEKCKFHIQTTTYLGMILSPKKIAMD